MVREEYKTNTSWCVRNTRRRWGFQAPRDMCGGFCEVNEHAIRERLIKTQVTCHRRRGDEKLTSYRLLPRLIQVRRDNVSHRRERESFAPRELRGSPVCVELPNTRTVSHVCSGRKRSSAHRTLYDYITSHCERAQNANQRRRTAPDALHRPMGKSERRG